MDYAEGRLRGRGALSARRGAPDAGGARLPAPAGGARPAVAAGDPVGQVADQLRRMSAAAGGLTARRLNGAGERARGRAARGAAHAGAAGGRGRPGAGGRSTAPRWPAQLERTCCAAATPARAGWPALDLRRARTRRFQAVFVLGLEEGGLPGRGARERLPERRRGGRAGHRRARLDRARPPSLLHRRHPPLAAAVPLPAGRRRGRPPARALAVPGGRRAGARRGRPSCAAARSVTSPTSSSRRPPSASGCGRWPANCATGRTGRRRWPRSRAGRASWSAPGPPTGAPRGCPTRRCWPPSPTSSGSR